MTVVAVLGGIIGAMIAPSPALATLPSTLMITGIASTTIPAALLMKKVGRKNGFLLASVIALCGTLLAAYAVAQHNFFLFCLAAFFIGSNSAFVQQYRFAAIESVDKSLSSKVVGFVLFAGIISGFFGPEIAKRSKDLFFFPEYSGPFLIIAVLILFSIILLSFLTKTRRVDEEKNIWVSLDLDVIDEMYAPGVGMPNKAGFTSREITTIAQYIGKNCHVVGVDVNEYNPLTDVDGKTAELGVELIAKMLGGNYSWYSNYMEKNKLS